MMEAKDTVMSRRIYESDNIYEERVKQAEISFKAGAGEEQKRMTKALRELHKQGWALSDVIEADDTFGED